MNVAGAFSGIVGERYVWHIYQGIIWRVRHTCRCDRGSCRGFRQPIGICAWPWADSFGRLSLVRVIPNRPHNGQIGCSVKFGFLTLARNEASEALVRRRQCLLQLLK